MRTVAVTNQKGGSGKTTTAVNVAAALVELGQKVLLVDLDPQASASAWCGVSYADRGLVDVFAGDDKVHLVHLVHHSALPGLDVIPASSWLMNAEKIAAGEVGAETLLRRAVEALPDDWDWLLMDCPPSLGLLSLSALVACREVLIPVEAHVMALAGLGALTRTIDHVRSRLNPLLGVLAIVPCRVDLRTNLARDVVERIRAFGGPMVTEAVVRESVRLAEAPSFHQPITVYAPTSSGAEDYRAVSRELVNRIRGRKR